MKRTRRIQRLTTLFAAVTLALLAAPQAQAAVVVTGISNPTASGPGLGTMSYNNSYNNTPNNDNVAVSDNLLHAWQKDFWSVDYIDVEFLVTDSGGTTEYVFREGVNNGTGVDWTDYHLVLGYGTGGSFVASGPGDGLDFDAPDEDSVYDFGPFTTLTITEDTIDAEGGVLPYLAFAEFYFPIDVPDGIDSFTVRQLPTIPEPASLGLLALGGFALMRRRRLTSRPFST